ncbi:MAG: hypothetical protein ACW975_05570 [Candidatus Thorarchaeota archaeon]
MMQDTPPDFLVDPIAYLQFYWNQISPFVFLVAALIIIGIVYIVVTRFAKRTAKRLPLALFSSLDSSSSSQL